MPHRVGLSVGEPGEGQERQPDIVSEGPVPGDPADRVGEDKPASIGRPVLHLGLEADRVHVGAEGLQGPRALHLDPAPLAVLAGLDAA